MSPMPPPGVRGAAMRRRFRRSWQDQHAALRGRASAQAKERGLKSSVTSNRGSWAQIGGSDPKRERNEAHWRSACRESCISPRPAGFTGRWGGCHWRDSRTASVRLEVARVADVFRSHALKHEVSPEAVTGEVGGPGGGLQGRGTDSLRPESPCRRLAGCCRRSAPVLGPSPGGPAQASGETPAGRGSETSGTARGPTLCSLRP